MSDAFSFTFEAREIAARPGQTLAAALTHAGLRGLRETKSGGTRGMFCGMGVCQDCLVEVDGRPNRRACLTKAVAGMAVRRQSALPQLGGTPKRELKSPARIETPDVLIVGGGAGGLSAAIEAARHGADTLVLDERSVSGGQYFKQTVPDTGARPLDSQQVKGLALIDEAHESGARIIAGAEVWGAFAGPVIYADSADGAVVVRPKALVVATGAYERPRMVPGWELPGVMTTGAAQTLWRSYRTLAGKRVAIVGNGPLNFQVALELLKGGTSVPLLAEAAPPPWGRAGPAAKMARGSLGQTLTGIATLAALKMHGSAPRFRTVVERIGRSGGGLRVTVRDSNGNTHEAEADAVCMNYGFHPQNEILRLLGAKMRYLEPQAELQPERSEQCETSVAGLFAVGDCCGMGGAPAAMTEGRIAGLAAAALALGQKPAPVDAALQNSLAGHRRFQSALWSLFAAPRQAFSEIDSAALVCRCEEVVAGDLTGGTIGEGAEIGSLKRATRLGMGPCQGRYCAQIVAPHIARANGGEVDERAFFAPRVPIKPVSIAAVMAAEDARRDG